MCIISIQNLVITRAHKPYIYYIKEHKTEEWVYF